MEFLLFIKNSGDLNEETQKLIDSFILNIKKHISNIETTDDSQEIKKSCHTLKGYFSNKDLKYLLRNGQEPDNIKKNFPKVKKLINRELIKLS